MSSGTITLGVDLASRSPTTAVCAVAWNGTSGVVRALAVGEHDGCDLHDKFLITSIVGLRDLGQDGSEIVKAGIDAPFGWPDSFVAALTEHHFGAGWPNGMDNPRARFCWRETDKVVRSRWNKTPLSVSTDRIAHVAMRCGVILAELAERLGSGAVDRTGTGLVCEVYPDPALRFWTQGHPLSLAPGESYRGTSRSARRRELLAILRDRIVLEDPAGLLELCGEHDHAIDALVAALVARAVWLRLYEPAPLDDGQIAREGWICLPTTAPGVLVADAGAE